MRPKQSVRARPTRQGAKERSVFVHEVCVVGAEGRCVKRTGWKSEKGVSKPLRIIVHARCSSRGRGKVLPQGRRGIALARSSGLRATRLKGGSLG